MKIVWISSISCNGNSHSFLNDENLFAIFENFEFLYHPLLEGRYSLSKLKFIEDFDILIIEGALRDNFKRGDIDIKELFLTLSKRASFIICVGNCASFGGIFKEADNTISGVLFNKEEKNLLYEMLYKKSINLPGCPIHPSWLFYTLFMIKDSKKILLDSYLRPKEIYAYLSHDGCVRNEYFEWKVDSEDFGLKEGCLYYKQGCQGPYTHSSCNKILWNSVNSKTRAGMPCIGCTEPAFLKREVFETKTNMSIPEHTPLGVSKRAYLTFTGIAKSLKNERLSKRLIDED